MSAERQIEFSTHLARLLDTDPSLSVWPLEFSLVGEPVSGMYDPRNALLVVYGAQPATFVDPELAPCLEAGETAADLCARLLVCA